MSLIRIAPIVEGEGEVQSIRILLSRIWTELVGGTYAEVLQPIRRPRTLISRPEEIRSAMELAVLKLREAALRPAPETVLLLMDVDPFPGPACELAPQLLELMRAARADVDSICVLANPEYETWFVAAAESLPLSTYEAEDIPPDPENSRSAKLWIQKRLADLRYSPTLHQASLTARMDLHLCRRRSLSFDKLCRELEARRQTD